MGTFSLSSDAFLKWLIPITGVMINTMGNTKMAATRARLEVQMLFCVRNSKNFSEKVASDHEWPWIGSLAEGRFPIMSTKISKVSLFTPEKHNIERGHCGSSVSLSQLGESGTCLRQNMREISGLRQLWRGPTTIDVMGGARRIERCHCGESTCSRVRRTRRHGTFLYTRTINFADKNKKMLNIINLSYTIYHTANRSGNICVFMCLILTIVFIPIACPPPRQSPALGTF